MDIVDTIGLEAWCCSWNKVETNWIKKIKTKTRRHPKTHDAMLCFDCQQQSETPSGDVVTQTLNFEMHFGGFGV